MELARKDRELKIREMDQHKKDEAIYPWTINEELKRVMFGGLTAFLIYMITTFFLYIPDWNFTTDMPKKVRTKRKAADGASGFGLPPIKLREDHGDSRDVGDSTAGKSLASLQRLLDSSTLAMEVGVTATETPATERFVVLSDSSHHSSTNAANDEVTVTAKSSKPPPHVLIAAVATTIIADATFALAPRAGTEPVPHSIFKDSASTGEANQDVVGPSHPTGTELSTDSFFVSQDVDSETLRQTYIPKWNVTNDSALDEPDISRGVIDHLAPLALFSQLCSMDYEQLFVLAEAKVAEAICLCGQIATIVAAKATWASELEGLKERNASLKGQVAALESAAVTKDFKLASSNTHIAKLTQDLSNLQLSCDELSIKASSLEFEKDKLVDQVSKLEGTCSELHDEVSELDANLIEMDLHLDEEFYPWAIGHAIDKGMQGGLAAGIDHGKAERGLTDSHKDASIADIMGLLHLEGSAAETPEASQLQPSPEKLMLLIHRLEDQMLSISDALVSLIEPLSAENLVGEASASEVLVTATTTSLSTTFIQTSIVLPVSAVDQEAFGMGPSTEVPSPSKI
ncbi:hypothetical protein Tco_1130747 [Tanacetum coccineum]